MRFTPIMSLLALSLPLLLVACPTPDPSTPPSAASGTLAITFSRDGLPANFEGKLLVTGPAGFSKTVKGSGALEVPAGTYTVTANPVRAAGPVVDTLFEGELETLIACCDASQDVVVTGNTTVAIGVEYSKTDNSGLLRLVGGDVAVPVTAGVLEAGAGSALPARQVCDADAQGAALDSDGKLWVACADSATLRQYSRLDFNPPRLETTINLPATTKPRGIAFDRSGNLWVVDAGGADRVLQMKKQSLESGGSVAPAASITVPEPSGQTIDANKAEGIAFDAAGNLWVSMGSNSDSLLRFDAATLTQNPSPGVVLTFSSNPFPGVNFSLFTPKSLAFDRDGNLWVSNLGNRTIAKFSPPFTTGRPLPALMLTSVGNNTAGLAFDNAGALWVGVAGELLKFAPDQLLGSGAVALTPVAALKVDLAPSINALVFAPAPSNLPIAP